mmetsp:Transcript_4748/g.9068  ORF Transcript_4748/g.9068 Transcript_4748/m.9068 type:complete len:442 (+) Transcript_4748:156-1481(+)
MNPTEELASSLSGEQIAKVLRSSGPIVSCVLLRSKATTSGTASSSSISTTTNSDPTDSKIGHADKCQESKKNESNEMTDGKRVVLEELIEEIKVDTTPKKQMVSQILGGPFTFVGQYEEEGIIVIVRKTDHYYLNRDNDDDDEEEEEEEEGNEDENDKDDSGVDARDDLPLNPHILQPPLHNVQVRGDILLMRVAAVEEETQEDAKDDGCSNDSNHQRKRQEEKQPETVDEENGVKSAETVQFLSNEDFFLDYTKEEYIKFASRTDILPNDSDENDEESEDESLDEDYNDEEEQEDADYNVESDEEDGFDDEECQVGVMNLILAQLLRKFREENGRGPNTSELLAMRSALAAKLGIDERLVNEECHRQECTEDDLNNNGMIGDKRQLDTSVGSISDQGSEQREKRVKFTNHDEVKIMTDDEATLEQQQSGATPNNQVEDAM